MATALGTVDVAAVDSLILDSMIHNNDPRALKVRIIWKSESFGPPPIVVPIGLDQNLEKKLLQAFLGLDKDSQGREILSDIGIKRFIPANENDYRSVIELYERFRLKDSTQ